VALSVQVLTFPIALYYFHQFPVYFFITGISAVVSAMFILGSGLVLLLLACFSFYPVPGYILLDKLISFLIESTYWVNNLPFGLIRNIYFDEIMVALAFAGIGGLIAYFSLRKKTGIIATIIFICFLFVYRAQHKINHYRNGEIVVYDMTFDMIDIIYEGKCYSFADERLTDLNRKYAAENYRIARHVEEVIELQNRAELNYLLLQNRNELQTFSFKSFVRPTRNQNFKESIEKYKETGQLN
jgi:competence protein ComEC